MLALDTFRYLNAFPWGISAFGRTSEQSVRSDLVGECRARFGAFAGKWPRGLFAVAMLAAIGSASAQSTDEYLKVTIGSDTTIRQVAEQYLSDPDLWPEILRSSGIASIADLRPGMELSIPVNEISAANRAP